MVYFWEGLEKENAGIFIAIWNILRQFGIFLVRLVIFWYIFLRFGTLSKSGNPDWKQYD
jgi:hypothetical protein